MNIVALSGRALERPFRPGGQRVVIKLQVEQESSNGHDVIEMDAFAKLGDYALANVERDDLLVVRGRLEERSFRDGSSELRVVAQHIERQPRPRAG